MSLNKRYLSILFLLAIYLQVEAQSEAKITGPRIEQIQNTIRITYGIQNSGPGDQFTIWVEISDANGAPIKARTLSGEIGKHVKAGTDKEVIWDPVADGISLEGGIYVQVFASMEESQIVKEAAESNKQSEKVNTTAILLQSLALPGLGLSRETGQPHWIKGVAGYGCLASTLVFNRMAVNTYDEYLNEAESGQRNELFEKAVSQDNTSEIFAFATIGIWVTDIIWNTLYCSKTNRSMNSRLGSVSVIPFYDPNARAQLVGVRISF